jgi:hypothetical protein
MDGLESSTFCMASVLPAHQGGAKRQCLLGGSRVSSLTRCGRFARGLRRCAAMAAAEIAECCLAAVRVALALRRRDLDLWRSD